MSQEFTDTLKALEKENKSNIYDISNALFHGKNKEPLDLLEKLFDLLSLESSLKIDLEYICLFVGLRNMGMY